MCEKKKEVLFIMVFKICFAAEGIFCYSLIIFSATLRISSQGDFQMCCLGDSGISNHYHHPLKKNPRLNVIKDHQSFLHLWGNSQPTLSLHEK